MFKISVTSILNEVSAATTFYPLFFVREINNNMAFQGQCKHESFE